MSVVETAIVMPDSLSPDQRAAMLKLMRLYYDNVHEDSFERDLQSKDWVICLHNLASGELVGFSTQKLLQESVGDQVVRALFSGDTIVTRPYWSSPTLAQAWGRFALNLIDSSSGEPLYWLLLSKGFRTYRFLPLFFKRYSPAIGVATPKSWHTLTNSLLHPIYGDALDQAAGIVRAVKVDNYRLQRGVADITPGRQLDPHIEFFRNQNPGHASGDELCCLAPLSRENFTQAARRVIGEPFFSGAK